MFMGGTKAGQMPGYSQQLQVPEFFLDGWMDGWMQSIRFKNNFSFQPQRSVFPLNKKKEEVYKQHK